MERFPFHYTDYTDVIYLEETIRVDFLSALTQTHVQSSRMEAERDARRIVVIVTIFMRKKSEKKLRAARWQLIFI